jgi:hypothetical protein
MLEVSGESWVIPVIALAIKCFAAGFVAGRAAQPQK